MAYDVKNAQIIWRGITITGFGDDHKYDITQNGDSFTQYKGVAGEGMNIVNNQRMWGVTTSLKADSSSLPILEADNDKRIEGTLIVRDLNIGKADVFEGCVVQNVSGNKDSSTRTVTFAALTKNGK